VLAQLKSLPEKLAARVARHLVAAAQLMDSDPETAYRHTLAARARASRVSVVREASGEAAYAAGMFKEALTEFKAARRMNHNPMYLPMMADCERGLGRPDRALTLAKDPQVVELDDAGQIEMKIVESGARRDLGDAPAAIRVLEGRELRSRSRASWVPRLRYAYAEALLADGQVAAAREWFERAAGVDADGYTDAAERLEALGDEGISCPSPARPGLGSCPQTAVTADVLGERSPTMRAEGSPHEPRRHCSHHGSIGRTLRPQRGRAPRAGRRGRRGA
jgi:tetratricopeptide (TPR) repeat protein